MISIGRTAFAAGVLFFCTGSLLIHPGGDCHAQIIHWSSRGVGGGGSLYSPNINPANNDEFYVGCDMSGLYHTTDFGSSYALMDFRQIQGGHDSRVQYTLDPKILYCITYANDQAIPVRTTDGGKTWSSLPGNPDPAETAYSIAADFNNPDHVIISYYGSVQSSTDGGKSFATVHTARNSGSGVTVGGAFFDGNSVYLGTNDGLLVSTNGGASFSVAPVGGLTGAERIFSFAGAKKGNALRFFCLTADSGDIYVGVPGSDYWGFMKGVYALDYGSASWTPRMTGISGGSDYLMYVAMAQNDTATAYLGGSNSSGVPNIMKTTNGGAAWTHMFLSTNNQNVSTGWSGDGGDRGWGFGECVFGLAVASNNSARVLFTDFGFVHRTTDGGTTWHQAYLSPSDENQPARVTPKGKSYRGIGLEVTSCWQVVWTSPSDVFACFTDIEGIRSTDGGETWSFNYSGRNANTMYRIVRNPLSGTLYAATSNIHDMYQSTRLQDAQLDANDPQGKIICSTDGGRTWTDIHLFGHPVFWLAPDTNASGRMYASVVHSTIGGVYVTNDLQDGASSVWTKIPSPPGTEGHPACLVVLKDHSLVCTFSGRRTPAGFTPSSGVFIYSPGTGTWTDVSDPGMRYWTKDIVVDPADSAQRKWYVGVFSGWGGPPNGLGGLYRTTNRGTSWTKINTLDRVTACAINPVNPSEAYLTTETSGLWHTTTLTTQSPTFTIDAAYPFRQPERVFFNPYRAGEVWVTSFGGGIMVGSPVSSVKGGDGQDIPPGYSLGQNYPNPFNPETRIRYALPHGSHVEISLFNTLGQRVRELVNQSEGPGVHEVRLDGTNLASGVYMYVLRAGNFIQSRKLLLIR
jgi:photosystem II stability/assembly factor-like uncharacterized protein